MCVYVPETAMAAETLPPPLLNAAPLAVSPCQVTANDLQENITKLNNGVTFMIKHSQKLFKVSALWGLALPGPSAGD